LHERAIGDFGDFCLLFWLEELAVLEGSDPVAGRLRPSGPVALDP
jgi:hypothetical protein